MKAGWVKTRLDDVATVQSGAGFPEKYQGRQDQNIPFYKVSDMNLEGNEHEMVYANNTISEDVRVELGASLFPKGSIIFPKIGGAIATNKKRLTSTSCCVDNNVMGAIPKKGKIDSTFLYYFFQSFDLTDFANAAHLPSIKKTVVENWPIQIPLSIAEQQRIVAILDEAFDGIATAKANAEQNLQNARALFDSHLQSVFSQNVDGWTDTSLGMAFQTMTGGTPPKDNAAYYGQFIPFVKPPELRDSTLDSSEDGLSEVGANVARIAPTNTILVSCIGNLGKVGLNTIPVAFNQQINAILPDNCKAIPSFMFYQVLSSSFRGQLDALASGTTVPIVNKSKFNSIRIIFPPIPEQRYIVAKLDDLREETQNLESIYQRKLEALDELKQSLLHQAFTGQL